jgi:hypothetical protein
MLLREVDLKPRDVLTKLLEEGLSITLEIRTDECSEM